MRERDGSRGTGVIGFVDSISEERIGGWVVDARRPHESLSVDLLKSGRFVARVPATHPRDDVRAAIDCDGRCGFQHRFDPPLTRVEVSEIEVRVVGESVFLSHSGPRPSAPAVRTPSIFVVGAPKCGTTSMYSYLGQHPEVFTPDIKEPNFFAPDLAIRSHPQIDTIGAYKSLYDRPPDRRVAADCSQFHLFSSVAAARIRAFAADAKIVILLREPVEFMRSLHAQYVATHDEDVLDFTEAVNRNDARVRGLQVPPRSLFPRCMAYLELARYHDQVLRYVDAFGARNVLVLTLEELRRSPHETVRRVYAHAGVSSDFVPDLQPRNVGRARAPIDWSEPATDRHAQSLRAEVAADVAQLGTLLDRDLASEWYPSSAERPAIRRRFWK